MHILFTGISCTLVRHKFEFLNLFLQYQVMKLLLKKTNFNWRRQIFTVESEKAVNVAVKKKCCSLLSVIT